MISQRFSVLTLTLAIVCGWLLVGIAGVIAGRSLISPQTIDHDREVADLQRQAAELAKEVERLTDDLEPSKAQVKQLAANAGRQASWSTVATWDVSASDVENTAAFPITASTWRIRWKVDSKQKAGGRVSV